MGGLKQIVTGINGIRIQSTGSQARTWYYRTLIHVINCVHGDRYSCKWRLK